MTPVLLIDAVKGTAPGRLQLFILLQKAVFLHTAQREAVKMLPLARQPPHKFPLRGHILQARPVPEVEDTRHTKRIRALLRECAVLILPTAWETRNKPKALVPVDNLPMLFHLFRKYPDSRYIVLLRECAVLILPTAWEVLGNAYVIARFVRQ